MAAPTTTSLGHSGDPVVDAIVDAYERFHPELVRRCQRVAGDRATAEEAAQEAFARALERRPAIDDGRPLEAWLTTVGTRAALDALRRRNRVRHEPIDDVTAVPALRAEDTVDLVTRGDARRRLGAALGRLPDRHRQALVLFGVEGMSYAQIADADGTSVPAVKMLIHRARERLKSAVHINDFHGAVPAGVGSTPDGRRATSGLVRRVREAAEQVVRWPVEATTRMSELAAKAGAVAAAGVLALVPGGAPAGAGQPAGGPGGTGDPVHVLDPAPETAVADPAREPRPEPPGRPTPPDGRDEEETWHGKPTHQRPEDRDGERLPVTPPPPPCRSVKECSDPCHMYGDCGENDLITIDDPSDLLDNARLIMDPPDTPSPGSGGGGGGAVQPQPPQPTGGQSLPITTPAVPPVVDVVAPVADQPLAAG